MISLMSLLKSYSKKLFYFYRHNISLFGISLPADWYRQMDFPESCMSYIWLCRSQGLLRFDKIGGWEGKGEGGGGGCLLNVYL